MARTISVAALQLALPGPVQPNIDAVAALVEEARHLHVAAGRQQMQPVDDAFLDLARGLAR